MSTLMKNDKTIAGLVESDKGSVSVTANGNKTYSTLFAELYGLIDFAKVTTKSTLTIGAEVLVARAVSANSAVFSNLSIGLNSQKLNTRSITITAGISEFATCEITSSAVTVSNIASTIPTVNTVISLNY